MLTDPDFWLCFLALLVVFKFLTPSRKVKKASVSTTKVKKYYLDERPYMIAVVDVKRRHETFPDLDIKDDTIMACWDLGFGEEVDNKIKEKAEEVCKALNN